ncbi:MAG: dihydropteroate synthase [Candidatus Aminicenantia bacterium]
MKISFPLNLKGEKIYIGKETWIMGILNVTPDSFSDGGDFFEKEKAVERGIEMEEEGAKIIDVGGESSRPGSDPISEEEERRRVIPVIKELRKKVKCLISIDTCKAKIAEEALDCGADIVNDISSLRFDSEMVNILKRENVPIIVMHMKGIPKTMQTNPYYENVIEEIKSFFRERLAFLSSNGIEPERVILDPGIGFGKRQEDNEKIIANLDKFLEFQRPILLGVSRKSFIGNILNLPPKQRLEGSISSGIIGIVNGAHILRVHDIKEFSRAIKVADRILKARIS